MKRASPPVVRWLLAGLLLASTCAFLAALWVVWLPDVSPLKNRPPATTAYIELRKRQAAAKGRKLDLRWTWVPAGAISENLRKAVVTAEDDEFWRHDGVDWAAIRAAYERNRKAGRFAAGGSTITMQLARNLYLSPSKNPLRKAKEILIARRLERELGKRRVLELYLNVVEWGKGVFGCEAAARAYFAKSCADLSHEEAVAMAVVLPNPRRWNPAKRGPYVERNSRRIMGRMEAADRERAAAAESAASAHAEAEADADAEIDAGADDDSIVEADVYSASTTVNSSTGSALGENGRNPPILE
ncbi:MAG: monofunctional biosynthetic peptidoglycan transglycosylase [Elusimicrobia bacterium]|nr:monofunctional biosynthetic peptidoglycan transglycosylase [Elusimicrobiota bacterium]